MSHHSPHRHLVPQGMRPRQRAELKAEFPTGHHSGLVEALREAIEQMQTPLDDADAPALTRTQEAQLSGATSSGP